MKQYFNKSETILNLLQGSYDLHIHSLPSHMPRLLNDLEVLKMADEYGMSGVMLKNHYCPTPNRAFLVNVASHTYTKAYGSAVLNWSIGGLNEDAAECFLSAGAKILWMPTVDALHARIFAGRNSGPYTKRPGITILEENGDLKKEIYIILEVVKSYDATIATGHLGQEESMVLCKEARKMGVKTILTHPEWPCTHMDVASQKNLAELGVIIEKMWLPVGNGDVSVEYMASTIKQLGAEHCFMATDRGQKNKESPVDAMIMFMNAMLKNGISADDIRIMTRDIPEQIIG